MSYRKLSASYIFSAPSGFLKNGILILDSDNRVIDLVDTGGNLNEVAKLEHYNGILTPGFVTMHYHLEPSHLHGIIPRGTGHPGFNEKLISRHSINDEQIQGFIKKDDNEVRIEGIVAEADIPITENKLSILEEMFVFQQHNPQTHLIELLKWATIEGAIALGIENQKGTFEKGKIPGVNLIEHVDLQRMILTVRSSIKKIA